MYSAGNVQFKYNKSSQYINKCLCLKWFVSLYKYAVLLYEYIVESMYSTYEYINVNLLAGCYKTFNSILVSNICFVCLYEQLDVNVESAGE